MAARSWDADLVVDRHDGDEGDILPQRAGQIAQIDQAIGADGDDAELGADAGEIMGGFKHAAVLGRQRHDAAAGLARRGEQALQRPIVAFGGATGEGDGFGRRIEERGDVGAGGLHRGLGLVTPQMGAVRVPKAGDAPRLHGGGDRRIERGGGAII